MNVPVFVRRAAVPAALALVGGLSLSGCSDVERADEAIRINDTVVTTQEAQSGARELAGLGQDGKPVAPVDVATLLAYGRFAEPIAAKVGTGVSDAAVLQQFPQAKSMSAVARETLRSSMMLRSNFQAQDPTFRTEFMKELKAADLEINPRYGSVDWNSSTGLPFVAGSIPWIKADGSSNTTLPQQ